MGSETVSHLVEHPNRHRVELCAERNDQGIRADGYRWFAVFSVTAAP